MVNRLILRRFSLLLVFHFFGISMIQSAQPIHSNRLISNGQVAANSQNQLVIDDVSVDSIFPDRIVISWNTNLESSTEALWQTNDYSEFQLSGSKDYSFQHSITLSGKPSQLIFVKLFSVYQYDTAYAEPLTVITASESTGSIKVYFNKTVNNGLSSGENAIRLTNAIDDTLVSYINRAKYSIDMAIYNMGDPEGLANIPGALNAAKSRGVAVRIVYDGSTSSNGIPLLNSGIGRMMRPESGNGIMHNKFMVIDAKSNNANDPLVWTGSTNMTKDQLLSDANSVVIIQDKSLASAYTIEFEEMFGSVGPQPNPSLSKFGSAKSNNTPHEFQINGKRIEMYFSPSDGVNSKIINSILSANHELYIATMLITKTDLANPIKSMYYQGIETKILVNTDGQCTDDVLAILKLLGLNFRDDGESGIMHHKYMIVDAKHPDSDPVVFVGCHNWSLSADTKNDENSLVIHDAAIANIYYQEFDMRYNAGVPLKVNDLSVPDSGILVYPNPSDGRFNIKVGEIFKSGDIIEIFDAQGRSVFFHAINEQTQQFIQFPILKTGLYHLIYSAKGSKQSAKFLIN